MRKLASIREIKDVFPMEGKDRIQGAVIDGWITIVPKKYKAGTVGVFFEIDSIIPERLVKELKLRGSRIKTMKMHGVISQGLFIDCETLGINAPIGEDVTELLGVKKYEKYKEFNPIKQSNGNLLPFPDWIQKTDEVRIQNLPEQLINTVDAGDWVAHEKVDGQSITFFAEYKPKPWWKFWGDDEVELGCCSRNYEVIEHPAHELAEKEGIYERLAQLALANEKSLYVQGELIGPGIQGNRYSKDKYEWYLFNAGSAIGRFSEDKVDEFWRFLKCRRVPRVSLYNLKETPTIKSLLKHAEGCSSIRRDIEREGIVIRHISGETSFKVISNKFLLEEK